jgi:hypothetical protein
MIVSVSSGGGAPIWERRRFHGESPSGLANPSFLHNGTQKKIVDALEEALAQAKVELSSARFQVGIPYLILARPPPRSMTTFQLSLCGTEIRAGSIL